MNEQQMNEQQENKQENKPVANDLNEKYLGQFTKKELSTLRNTIAAGTNDQEFMLFVQTCVNTGLNPFLNHIHCAIYNGKNGRQLSIQISAEGVMYLARKQKGFRGLDAQLVHENDNFQIDLATKKIVKHEIGFPRGQVVGGYAIARHEDFEDKILLMDVQEVEHLRRGKQMWATWFNDMFKKHMLKRVAKEQYGIDLTEDEAVQSQPQTFEQVAQTNAAQQQQPSQGRIEIGEGQAVDPEEQRQQLWNEIEGNVDAEIIDHVLKHQFNGRNEKELKLPELAAFKKFAAMEMNRRKQAAEAAEQPKDEMEELENLFA